MTHSAISANVQTNSRRRTLVIRSAAITPLYLIGSFFVGAMLGSLIVSGLPGHMQESDKIPFAATAALACVIAGGALWGRAMGRLVDVRASRRLTWAGALGYGPTVILVGLALTVLEQLIVEQHQGPQLPIHNVFTLLFVPAVAIVAAVGALALGIALKQKIVYLALGSGLIAGAAFLLVDVLLDSFYYRVGAVGAAERVTMLTHLFVGSVLGSLAAGAFIGLVLGTEDNQQATQQTT